MKVRVLIVDDSGFFRRRIAEIFSADPHLEVVGAAVDGADAIVKVAELKPDVVTMDVEMPVLDGISAVRRIMATHPTPILMFSTLTQEGAKATFDALEAGAVDFLPKRLEDIASDQNEARRQLCARVRLIGARGLPGQHPVKTSAAAAGAPASAPRRTAARRGGYRVLAIGASTGGPAALQQLVAQLPSDFPLPVLIIQHMPATFTLAFAQRLDQLCQVRVREAADGDVLAPGMVYVAPGGRQMLVEEQPRGLVVRIQDAVEGQNYRPCIDLTYQSLAKVLPGQVLALVLTGMGADGREGARSLKQGGSVVWAQDEASCVVYGMPAAVVEAGLADHVVPLAAMGAGLIQEARA